MSSQERQKDFLTALDSITHAYAAARGLGDKPSKIEAEALNKYLTQVGNSAGQGFDEKFRERESGGRGTANTGRNRAQKQGRSVELKNYT